jgi:cell division septum initiation protein DivIVA
MSKKSSSSNITSDNTSNVKSTDSLYDTNIQNNQQQDFTDSINRSLDQTKDNINRSIDESRNQIPHYNNIVNSYQEQTLQAAREISENFIESQKSIINSIQSAWIPFSQNFNTKATNSCISPEAVANAYSRFVSTVADNAVSALRTTNNIIFSSLDSWKSTVQQAKDNSKHLFNLNSNAAKTFEQNAREVTAAAQDTSSRFNASINNNYSSSNTNTTTTAGTSSTTTSSTTSAA